MKAKPGRKRYCYTIDPEVEAMLAAYAKAHKLAKSRVIELLIRELESRGVAPANDDGTP